MKKDTKSGDDRRGLRLRGKENRLALFCNELTAGPFYLLYEIFAMSGGTRARANKLSVPGESLFWTILSPPLLLSATREKEREKEKFKFPRGA